MQHNRKHTHHMFIMNNDSEEVMFEYTGKEFNFPKDMTILRFHPSITKIKACLLGNYTQLREVVLHEGILQIGKEAFQDCASLESVTLPSTMIKIHAHAFHECTRLRNIIFNNGLREIETFAFYGCTSLECITIPSTVTDIGNYAFHGCANLREVELKDDGLQIQNMGKYIFGGCSSMERLPFPSISTRLRNIISTDQVEVKSKIDELLGIEIMIETGFGNDVQRVTWRPIVREGTEIYLSLADYCGRCEVWGPIKQCLDKIVKLIRYYEIKEETTLFELHWKAKMDQLEVPGPVKDTILQYLL